MAQRCLFWRLAHIWVWIQLDYVSLLCLLITNNWMGHSCAVQASNRSTRNQLGRPFLFYSVYGWGVPLSIVVVGQILQHVDNLSDHVVTPGFGIYSCWFNGKFSILRTHIGSASIISKLQFNSAEDQPSIIAYLYGPMLAMLLTNIVMFIWTAISFCRTSILLANVTSVTHSTQRYFNNNGSLWDYTIYLCIVEWWFPLMICYWCRFRVILSLFFLMGVSWFTEVISVLTHNEFSHWIFSDIINILTGVFVFIIFVCKPKVWNLLKVRVSIFLATPTCRRILPCIVHSGVNSLTKTECINSELTKETNVTSQSL